MYIGSCCIGVLNRQTQLCKPKFPEAWFEQLSIRRESLLKRFYLVKEEFKDPSYGGLFTWHQNDGINQTMWMYCYIFNAAQNFSLKSFPSDILHM